MKRIRCPLSLCDQFLKPASSPRTRTLLPRPRAPAQKPLLAPQTRRPLSTSTPRPSPTAAAPAAAPADAAPPLLITPSRDPHSSAKLAALHARLSLRPNFPIETLARALIDQTADANRFYNNSSLAFLGNSLLGYYSTEHFLCTYPRLPTVVLQTTIAAFVGTRALAAICREWGVESAFEPTPDVDAGLLQFKHLPPGTEYSESKKPSRSEGVPEEQAMADFVRSTFAGVYLHEGVAATKQFFRQHVLSRKLELDRLFNFTQPTRELSRLCQREGFAQPVARLLSETGRMSKTPVFIVGIYSGKEVLGEGEGGSLDEAKTRAAVNALKGWYLYSPFEPVDLPSKTDVSPEASFKPAMIDAGEVIV